MLQNVIILCLLTGSLFLSTVLSAPDEFTTYDLILISLVIVGMIIIQSTIAYIVLRLTRRATLTAIFLSICVVFNIYCVHLAFIETFAPQPLYIKMGLLVLGTVIVFTLLAASISKEVKHGATWVVLIVVAMSSINIAVSVFGMRKAPTPATADNDGSEGTASPNVRLVDFSKKPNVYIVSFDSLLPRRLADKHLGLNELAYNDVLEENFTVFRNMFADYVNTIPALNSFVALDMSYFRSLGNTRDRTKAGDAFWLVQGGVPGPLYQIFKHNGYATHWIYPTTYLGSWKGPFLDYYHTSNRFSACWFVDRSNILAFFGLCRIQKAKVWTGIENLIFLSDMSVRVTAKRPDTNQLFSLSVFDKFLSSKKPNFFYTYIYSPGHTTSDYDHSDQRKREAYIEKHREEADKTASILEQIIAFLQEKDEKGILILFADHGPWLARRMKFEQDPEFVVQDRFGIAGGIYPANVCPDYIVPLTEAQFVTPTRLVRAVIKCLADGRDPFISDPSYRLFPQWRLDISEPRRYEEFLYE